MAENYFIFPMETMNVTQSYTNPYSHLKHTEGNPKDYPLDLGGIDSGQSAIFCPCDEMVITAIKGVGQKDVSNTVWLVSTTSVKTPSGIGTVFMTLTHSNDNDLKRLKVGQIFKRKQVICYEGTDSATANHIHMVCGFGSSNNWLESTSGVWVIKGDCRKPETMMYIDTTFTKTIKNNGNLNWPSIPIEIKPVGTPISRNDKVNQIQILLDNVNGRNKANGVILGYIRRGFYNSLETIKLENYEWHRIEKDLWVAYDKNWAIFYPKKDNIQEPSPDELEKLKQKIEKLTNENNSLKQELSSFLKYEVLTDARYFIKLYKDETLIYKIEKN